MATSPSEAARLNEEEIQEVAEEFVHKLGQPATKTPPRPLIIGIVKSPGSGGTTAGRQLAKLFQGYLVQANDARVLLAEHGLSWGANAHTIVKAVVENMLGGGWPVILDGMVRTKQTREEATQLATKYGAGTYFIGVTCEPRISVARARLRYADNKPSTFGDWRCSRPKFDQYLWDIVDLDAKLRADLHNEADDPMRGVQRIDNSGNLGQLSLQVGVYGNTIKHHEQNR